MAAPVHTALPPDQHPGLVIASHGRHVMVESPDGSRRICHPRGKKSQALVGDQIHWQAPPAGQGEEGTIEAVLPRRNVFYRQDDVRTKAFAANIDQILIWLAAEPEFSQQLLGRALIAAEAANIPALIVLNKSDLTALHAQAWQRLAPYRAMGYTTLGVSLHQPCDALHALKQSLQGKKSLLMGPSGTGKSSFINWLLPTANVQTNEISRALNSGRHTTTSTMLHWIDRATDTAAIDSPGFQEFGIHHLAATDLARYMPDIAHHTGACRFYNCSHLHEPGCEVLNAVGQPLEQKGIDPLRHQLYAQWHAELSASKY